MEAIEFDTTMHSNGKIELPAQFRKNIKKNTKLRVIVMIEEPTKKNEDGWQKQAASNFFKDDNDADDVYNNL